MDILSITNKSSVSADAKVYTKDGSDFVTTTFDALYNKSSAKMNIEKSVSDANARIDTTNNTVAELDNYARAKANGIVLQSQGEMVTVNDSSDDYVVNIKPYGKSEQDSTTGAQLYDVTSYEGTSATVDTDGWYTVEYDNTNGTEIYYTGVHTPASDILKTSTKYAIIAEVQSINNAQLQYVTNLTITSKGQFNVNASAESTGTFITVGSTRDDFSDCLKMLRSVVVIPAGVSGSIKFRLSVLADTSITADTFVYEKYTGGKPSPNPDYPQEIRSTVISEVRSCGKNLLNARLNTTISKNDYYDVVPMKNSIYTISLTQKCLSLDSEHPSAQHWMTFYDEDGNVIRNNNFLFFQFTSVGEIRNGTFTFDSGEAVKIRIDLGTFLGSSTTEMTTIEAQLELGSTATEYEPYTETVATLSEPITLYGIPTTSGGNFTDSNGQQWIADYIDVAKGKVVRKIDAFDMSTIDWVYESGSFRFYGNPPKDSMRYINTYQTAYALSEAYRVVSFARFSNETNLDGVFAISANGTVSVRNLDYTTIDDFKSAIVGINMIYALATPVAEDLPTADVVALKNLKTFYSVTNVTNDSEVKGEMVLSYNADTKMYIDNKFAELAAQLV